MTTTEPAPSADPEVTVSEVITPEVVEILTPQEAAPLPAPIPKTVPGLADVSIVPEVGEWERLCSMALTLSKSTLVPNALRGKPQDVLLVLLSARDIGIAMTAALRELHVIDGKVTVSPKVKSAMVRSRHLGDIWPHQAPRPNPNGPGEILCKCGLSHATDLTNEAEWHAERFDQPGMIYTSRYSTEMAGAVSMKVYEKNGNTTVARDGSLLDKDNWKNYGHQMVKWRALGYLMDDAFPEVATGLYTPDEMGANTDENGEPITVDSVQDPFAPGPGAARSATDPEPNPDAYKELADRIAKVKANRPALVAMATMWTAPTQDADGKTGPKLPPFNSDRFRHRHMAVATAIVSTIERRILNGDFPDDGGATSAQEPEGEAPSTPQPTEQENADTPESEADPIEAAVAAMADPEVDAELTERGIKPSPIWTRASRREKLVEARRANTAEILGKLVHTPLTMGDMAKATTEQVMDRAGRIVLYTQKMPMAVVSAIADARQLKLGTKADERTVRAAVGQALIMDAGWDPDTVDPGWADNEVGP